MPLLPLVFLLCCAPRGTANTPPPPSLIRHALELAQEDRLEAIEILEAYLDNGEDAELLGVVTLFAGEQRRLAGDASGARAHFGAIASRPDLADGSNLGSALVDYASSGSGNALASIEMAGNDGVPDTMNADRYRILALSAEADAAPRHVVDAHVEAAVNFSRADTQVEARVYRSLAHLMDEDAPIPELALGEDLSAEAAALDRARDALLDGDTERASELAKSLIETFPDSDYVDDAAWVERLAKTGNQYDSGKIGVLLPLSGRYASPGNQIKDALTLAADGAGVELVFRDTEGELETSIEEFEDLVLEQGVSSVLGPLLKENVRAVAEEAQAAGVSLVAMSQTPDLTEIGPYVFRGLATVDQQVDGLLDYVMDELGLRDMAVIAPDNTFGQTASDSFVRQVLERGGTVEGLVMYDPQKTSFRKEAAELAKKEDDPNNAQLYRLQEEAEARGMDPRRVVLPPTVNYEAIFIPDSAGRVNLVAASLAYEEFAIGGFTPRSSLAPTPLLGLNSWRSDLLLSQGGKYVVNCYFPDVYDSGDFDPLMADYASRFSGLYNRTPGPLEAMAADAGAIVYRAAQTRPEDRRAFREALLDVTLQSPVSGAHHFGASREIDRSFLVMTVDEATRGGSRGARTYFRRVDEPPIIEDRDESTGGEEGTERD